MAQKTQDAGYEKRVWAGDSSTVMEALEDYERDPKKGLLPFAVALYSARRNPALAKKLVTLRPGLLAAATEYLSTMPSRFSSSSFGNEGDVLSTYLEWLSRRPEFSQNKEAKTETYQMACRVFSYAADYAKWYPQDTESNHPRCLLELTMARLHLTGGDRKNALERLKRVEEKMHVPDPNQRVRVYRKLGMLYRMAGKWLPGVRYGLKALFVPGVPRDVRLKSLAAFFIDL